MKQLLATEKGKGALPLGSHCGNVEAQFGTGRHMDHPGGPRRGGSGANFANHGNGGTRGNSLAELGNVNGRSGKADGQRYGGSPVLSGSKHGPSGRSKKSKGISGQ